MLHRSSIGDNPCDLGVGAYFLKRQCKNIVKFLSFSFKLRTSVLTKRLTMHFIKYMDPTKDSYPKYFLNPTFEKKIT